MVIKSLLDITEGKYIFNFKYQSGYPEFPPIFEGDITIWVSREGVVVKGKKICGHVGNSLFKVGGTANNSPLAKSRTMLCKWEDVEVYHKWNRRASDIKIVLYPNKVCTYMKCVHIVDAHIRKAKRLRNEIFRVKGIGVSKEICDNLASRGYWYKDGGEVFCLNKKKGCDSYFYMKVMSVNEFKKVEGGLSEI